MRVSDVVPLPIQTKTTTKKTQKHILASVMALAPIKVESTLVSGGEDVSGATTAEA